MDRLFCSTGADGDSLVVKEPNSAACLCFKDQLPARAGCEPSHARGMRAVGSRCELSHPRGMRAVSCQCKHIPFWDATARTVTEREVPQGVVTERDVTR